MKYERVFKNEWIESTWYYDTDKSKGGPVRIVHNYTKAFDEYLKAPKQKRTRKQL